MTREEGSVTRALFLQAAAVAELEPHVAASLGSREMVKEAAAADLGIVFDGEIGADARLVTLSLVGEDAVSAEVFLTCREDLAGLGADGALVRLAQASGRA
ncbi:hypothetical protein ACFOGJ_25980 [Marinibaculum pumilum]|uniref:Uncharacterized protein n=1 Tax=Marinibaculum pumilum TaxID=1766165 RepID=A0ABV7L800_9PROT